MDSLIPVYYFRAKDNIIKDNEYILKKKVRNKKEMVNHFFNNRSNYCKFYIIVKDNIITLHKQGTIKNKEIDEEEIQYIDDYYDFDFEDKKVAIFNQSEKIKDFEIIKIDEDGELLPRIIKLDNIKYYFYEKIGENYVFYYNENIDNLSNVLYDVDNYDNVSNAYLKGKETANPIKLNNVYEIIDYINKMKE